LPVVLPGIEACSLSLREAQSAERIFGFKKEGTGESRKLHNKEFHKL
jgi:hypothetical protein